MSPGSSTEERSVSNREAGGAAPPRGLTYLYALVRKDFASGALLSQSGHALTECLLPEDLPLPKDTRIVVLGCTKEELAKARFDLDAAGVHTAVVTETDGPLAGCITAIGLLTRDRDSLKHILGPPLRPWREPK